MEYPFRDRSEAGQALAQELGAYTGRDDVIVLALPRGGVPVAFEVARALQAPLDVFVVRKLGVPGHEELAMGAIASGGVLVIEPGVIEDLAIPPDVVTDVAAREEAGWLVAKRLLAKLWRAPRNPELFVQGCLVRRGWEIAQSLDIRAGAIDSVNDPASPSRA